MDTNRLDFSDLRETVVTLARCRYFIIVCVFLVWIAFVDDDNLIVKYSQAQAIERLETEKANLEAAIQQDKRKMSELRNNTQSLEKFAREEYYMKKDNEVIFILK